MPMEDSKPVKKEEENNNNSSGSKKFTTSNTKPQNKVAKVKKEEAEPITPNTSASRSKVPKVKMELDDDDDKPLAKRASISKEVKKKKKIKQEEKKKEEARTEQKKREKKVYDLPGQKRDPPEEKDPLRVFYQTLYKQIPNSEMSQIWLMESGLLPKELAMKVYAKKQKKALQQKVTSPVKAGSAVKSSTKSVTVKKKGTASSVKKKTTNSATKQSNSASKQSKKRKSECLNSDDDSDFAIDSAMAKRRKAA